MVAVIVFHVVTVLLSAVFKGECAFGQLLEQTCYIILLSEYKNPPYKHCTADYKK